MEGPGPGPGSGPGPGPGSGPGSGTGSGQALGSCGGGGSVGASNSTSNGGSGKSKAMRREPSVEDLFAPMWRLDVHSTKPASEDADSNREPEPESCVATSIPIPRARGRSGSGGSSSATSSHSWPSSTSSGIADVRSVGGAAPASGAGSALCVGGHEGLAPAQTAALSNSASDDDQVAVDERKQRRMLSNRESARRSRLRKQQHLDELRAQVAHLRGENNQIMSKFTLATQHYAQISEENRVLRSHAMDLSRQLQRLHHAAVAHNAAAGFLSVAGSSTVETPAATTP